MSITSSELQTSSTEPSAITVMASSPAPSPSQVEAQLKERLRQLELRQAELEREHEQLLRTQEQLEKERRKYQKLYEEAPVGYVDVDDKGFIRQINVTAANFLRQETAELIGKPFVHFINPRDIQKFIVHLRQTFQGQTRRALEIRLRLSGHRTPLAVQLWSVAIQDSESGNLVCRSTLTDISDRKLAEEALRESKECFRIMTDTAPVLVWMSGADGLCTYFNKSWMEFTGRTLKQELGNGWLECLHADDLQRTLDAYHLAFESREKFHFELRLRRNDGQYRWFLNTGVPRFTPTNAFAGYLGSCIDITERKEAEEMRREILEDFEILVQERTANLIATNRKLREEVSARKRLEKQIVEIADSEKHRIGNDLHDGLGQQLTGLAFMSKVLAQKLTNKSLPEGRDATQIHSLLNQALTYTRELARGLHVVELEAGGLNSALHELRSHLETLYSITCEVNIQKNVAIANPHVATHVFRIAQEAVNNAVKHGQATKIGIELFKKDKKLILTVRDNGTGFPHGPHVKKGMGLHTMRYRAEMIRGSFEVQRPPEGGAMVVCSFPIQGNKKSAH